MRHKARFDTFKGGIHHYLAYLMSSWRLGVLASWRDTWFPNPNQIYPAGRVHRELGPGLLETVYEVVNGLSEQNLGVLA
jgi:hypothetical protein